MLNLLIVSAAQAATPPAGTKITNVAQVQTSNPLDTVNSNSVEVYVNNDNSAVMSIVKSADLQDVIGYQQIVTYTLKAANNGEKPVLPVKVGDSRNIAIQVDGVATSLVLMRDEIPKGLTFSGGLSSDSNTAIKLYRLKGTAPFSYQTTVSDPTQVIEVAIGEADTIKVGASFTLSFKAQMTDSSVSQVDNTGFVTFGDNNGNKSIESNKITLRLTPLLPADLTVVKTVKSRGISANSYQLDYTITVKNTGSVAATFLRLSDNLNCTFKKDKSNGYVKKWTLQSAPVMKNGLLESAGAAFTGATQGSNNCDFSAVSVENGKNYFTETGVNLSNGKKSLAAGEEEEITFSVLVELLETDPVKYEFYTNYVVAGAFSGEEVTNSAVLVAKSASAVDVLPKPSLTVQKTVARPRKISRGVYDLDYSILVKNASPLTLTNVQVTDNLNCTFMKTADNSVKKWTLMGAPVMHNHLLLSAGTAYQGLGSTTDNCDFKSIDPNTPATATKFLQDANINLTQVNRPLKPDDEEKITFTVRVELNSVDFKAVTDTFENYTVAGAGVKFSGNTSDSGAVVVAAEAAAQAVLIDPMGKVYDSTDPTKLIAGAKVIFTREQCTGASNLSLNMLVGGDIAGFYTQESANSVSMITDETGDYFFTIKPPLSSVDCDYSLTVITPAGYTFQSHFAPQTGFASDGVVSGQGVNPPTDPSTALYYLKFHLGPSNPLGVFFNHIPVDPTKSEAKGLLILKKEASKKVVEMVDFLDYTLTLTNQTGADITGFTIVDNLPAGFAYEAGSSLLNNAHISDPEGGKGPVITWTDNSTTIAMGESVTLTHRVRVGVGAVKGDAINSAIAHSNGFSSQLVTARVQVVGGVFSDEGFIIGKVYLDCNADRVQGNEELGVPGVKVFLEDGTSAISDVEGKYSFYGIKPITHVLKVDNSTLPAGSMTIPLANRNSGHGDSRFVDLKKSELHKADFAIHVGDGRTATYNCDNGTVVEDVLKRRAALAERSDDSVNALLQQRLELQPTIITSIGDKRSLPASGLVSQLLSSGSIQQSLPASQISTPQDETKAFNSVTPLDINTVRPSALPDAPLAPAPVVNLETQITTLNNSLGFVDLKDNDTLPMTQANVRVKGMQGGSFRLSVNGVEISTKRVGKRSSMAEKQLDAWEYIGVEFSAGKNLLKLEQLDLAGNARGETTITLIAPDALGKLELDMPKVAKADGKTPITMKLRLTDNNGVPVTARTQVTIETDKGQWVTKDLSPTEQGTQLFVEGGSVDVVLMPPSQPSDGLIRISTGTIKHDVKIAYVPELSAMTGVGIIEGIVDMRTLGSNSLTGARPFDAFESELNNISTSSNDGKLRAAARTAFFFKGTVFEDYLITAAYDSNKELNERLFRDIQPDLYYPIYGDSAVKSFDAQSTQRTYVRIDRDKSYLLYGDYITAGNSDVRQLTQYSRTLTGAKGHYEDNDINATAFYSRTNSTRVVDEFPANGTSGPYAFTLNSNYIENSEKVEVLVRDRNQPSLVIATNPQTRFTDYDINPITKQLLFRGPIPSLDANLNPQYIRITFESGINGIGGGTSTAIGKQYGIGGIDAQYKLTDDIQVGAIAVKDDNPINKYLLLGTTSVVRLGEKTLVKAEFARSDVQSSDSSQAIGTIGNVTGQSYGVGNVLGIGNAGRIEFISNIGDFNIRAQVSKVEAKFVNQTAFSTPGRTEIPVNMDYVITPNLKFKAEGLYSKDDVHGGSRIGGVANLATRLMDSIDAEFGMRISKDHGTGGSGSCVSGLSMVTSNCMSTGNSSLTSKINNELLTVRAKLMTQVPWVTGLQTYIEAEQDIYDVRKHLFAVGANYQWSEKTRIFGRYQLLSSLGSQFALNSFTPNNVGVLGVESAYMQGGSLFNELRLRDGQSGREAQNAIGLRNTWELFEGLQLGTGFETTKSFNGLASNNSTAVTGRAEYSGDSRYRISGSLELRKASTNDSVLNTFAGSYKIDRDWSLLGRTIFNYMTYHGTSAGDSIQTRQQIGLAYREVDTNIWNALMRYEHRYENATGGATSMMSMNSFSSSGSSNSMANNTLTGDRTTDTHIVSAHLNYQVDADLILAGHYAGKYLTSDYSNLSTDYWAQLFSGRLTWDFHPKLDLSLQSSYYLGKGGASQYAVGAEMGYQVVDNTWLSVGYNLSGINDPDLTANNHLDGGPYARIRFKFDENTLSNLF